MLAFVDLIVSGAPIIHVGFCFCGCAPLIMKVLVRASCFEAVYKEAKVLKLQSEATVFESGCLRDYFGAKQKQGAQSICKNLLKSNVHP